MFSKHRIPSVGHITEGWSRPSIVQWASRGVHCAHHNLCMWERLRCSRDRSQSAILFDGISLIGCTDVIAEWMKSCRTNQQSESFCQSFFSLRSLSNPATDLIEILLYDLLDEVLQFRTLQLWGNRFIKLAGGGMQQSVWWCFRLIQRTGKTNGRTAIQQWMAEAIRHLLLKM